MPLELWLRYYVPGPGTGDCAILDCWMNLHLSDHSRLMAYNKKAQSARLARVHPCWTNNGRRCNRPWKEVPRE